MKKCTLSHAMQVVVRPSIVALARSITVIGAEASSKVLKLTSTIAMQRIVTFLTVKNVRRWRKF
jgi:hypothetical protein